MSEDTLKGMRIGCAMTGSFCTFERAYVAWHALADAGAELTPIFSLNAALIDTRFGRAADHVARMEKICGRHVICTLAEAEPIGPKRMLDLLIIAPCTGNTLGKLANGIADTPVTLACKAHLRNARPVLLAISTNDALGGSAPNIGQLVNRKHFYFVPFGQDAPDCKPNSLVADFSHLPESALCALRGIQIQPLLTVLADKTG